MPTGNPLPIPFPLSSFPGANSQEGAGRLINTYAEPLGEAQKPTGPTANVWRRSPGLSQHAMTAQSGYRGGLIVNNLSYETWANDASTIDINGVETVLGNFPGTQGVSIAANNDVPTADVVAVDPDNGAYILNTAALGNASITATIAGGSFVSGDVVSLQFVNPGVVGLPVTVVYTLGAGASATTVATGLKNLINANATLSGANIAATSALGVVTITQSGSLGNSTQLNPVITGTGSETVTFNPASGVLAGGTGTAGITFTGAPLAYNGGGSLPQPRAVCFQDGYLFFLIADCRIFATFLNGLTINALTFATANARSGVVGQRCIAFAGLLMIFTSGHCELWQDTAQPYPGFPYSRLTVLENGLIQPNAIAGFEVGFAELLWVSQDFKVRWSRPAAPYSPLEVSPPDLEKLIEAQIKAGNILRAGCYAVGGKKFWYLSSPAWTWELNLSANPPKWTERQSLQTSGIYGPSRMVGGHSAFNRWLMGDAQSGNLLYPDTANFTENGMPLLWRIESGPVRVFPQSLRVARADFDFDMGVGIAVGNVVMTITGAAAGTGGVVRLTVNNTAQTSNNDTVIVTSVGGTTEANGTWPMTLIDSTHIELQGSVFVNAYTSGGSAVDLTSPPQAINPQVAISMSKDGGYTFDNPSLRILGQQGHIKRTRASVKNRGLSTQVGVRWRLDVTDPVYVGFLQGTQSSDPREVGA